jgi:MurNAc alpha-1-phosphate uridylyltransferase
LVINGDVFAPDFPFERIMDLVEQFRADIDQGSMPLLAYLFLVPNPSHHPKEIFI